MAFTFWERFPSIAQYSRADAEGPSVLQGSTQPFSWASDIGARNSSSYYHTLTALSQKWQWILFLLFHPASSFACQPPALWESEQEATMVCVSYHKYLAQGTPNCGTNSCTRFVLLGRRHSLWQDCFSSLMCMSVYIKQAAVPCSTSMAGAKLLNRTGSTHMDSSVEKEKGFLCSSTTCHFRGWNLILAN